MAIGDLLWACPVCSTRGGIRRERDGERCSACGARFLRGPAAMIVVEEAGGARHEASAAAWLERLPPATERLPVEARALVRFGLPPAPVRRRRELLGWVERFGDPLVGTLRLEAEALGFVTEHGRAHRWPLEDVTGVQPSSGTLQVKVRHRFPVAFAFPDDTVHRWELLLGQALQGHWRACGWGTIREYQPRVVGERNG